MVDLVFNRTLTRMALHMVVLMVLLLYLAHAPKGGKVCQGGGERTWSNGESGTPAKVVAVVVVL